MLTIAEFAKRYDLPESTARFYCKRFRDFLPHSGQGKRRRYHEESIPVFEAILQGMGQEKNAALVEDFLTRRFQRRGVTAPRTVAREPNALPTAPAAPPEQGRLETIMQQQTEALQQVAAVLQSLAQERTPAADTASQELSGRLQALEENVAQLQKEVRSLRSLQDDAERIHQQDLEQLRKWLGHLAKEHTRERQAG
jgi:DNA-binding transcriptional MerR regulator